MVAVPSQTTDAPAVTYLVPVVIAALFAYGVARVVRRHRRGLVAERGTSIGADLKALADQPRVRVRSLTKAGPDRFLLVLESEAGAETGPDAPAPTDVELLVSLREEAFGFDLLHEWKRAQTALAIVMPPNSRIVRLRSIDDLQPLTLSRVEPA